MKKLLRALGLARKQTTKVKPLELHKQPWHPLFYKTLTLHIQSTTRIRRF